LVTHADGDVESMYCKAAVDSLSLAATLPRSHVETQPTGMLQPFSSNPALRRIRYTIRLPKRPIDAPFFVPRKRYIAQRNL